MANLLQKLIFRSGIYVTIADADIQAVKDSARLLQSKMQKVIDS